jgi:hypothetical protein
VKGKRHRSATGFKGRTLDLCTRAWNISVKGKRHHTGTGFEGETLHVCSDCALELGTYQWRVSVPRQPQDLRVKPWTCALGLWNISVKGKRHRSATGFKGQTLDLCTRAWNISVKGKRHHTGTGFKGQTLDLRTSAWNISVKGKQHPSATVIKVHSLGLCTRAWEHISQG